MNSMPNPKPTEPDNALIEQITKAIATPDATAAGDALVERADIGQARADEKRAQANEQVTQSASNPKATESANGLIEPADERRAREREWISKQMSDAVQDLPPVPVRPLAAGRPVLRGLVGLLMAASIFVAAFVSQSSQIDPAELTVVRWVVAQLDSTSSEPLNQSERRVPRGVSAAQLNAAESMVSQPTPSPQTAPQDVAATASLSLDQAQMLQVIARDLAKLGQRIEELNARQEQMAGENAKPDLAQTLQAMAPDLAKLGQRIEELNTRQDQLARDNAKTAEQIEATREQMARFLAARASEYNPQPKTTAPKPH
jgi:hypothetical protein